MYMHGGEHIHVTYLHDILEKAYIDDVDQGSRSPLAIIPLGIGPSSNDTAQQGETQVPSQTNLILLVIGVS